MLPGDADLPRRTFKEWGPVFNRIAVEVRRREIEAEIRGCERAGDFGCFERLHDGGKDGTRSEPRNLRYLRAIFVRGGDTARQFAAITPSGTQRRFLVTGVRLKFADPRRRPRARRTRSWPVVERGVVKWRRGRPRRPEMMGIGGSDPPTLCLNCLCAWGDRQFRQCGQRAMNSVQLTASLAYSSAATSGSILLIGPSAHVPPRYPRVRPVRDRPVVRRQGAARRVHGSPPPVSTSTRKENREWKWH